jgi:hypothetical protein
MVRPAGRPTPSALACGVHEIGCPRTAIAQVDIAEVLRMTSARARLAVGTDGS